MSEKRNILNDISAALAHFPKPVIERGIEFEKISNARQLGGITTMDGRVIKDNLLLRTAHLADASEADLKKLEDVYKVSLVIDLRTIAEHENAPDKELANAKNIGHSLMETQLKNDDMKKTEESFGQMVNPEAIKTLSIEQYLVYACKLPQMQKMISSLYIAMVTNKDSQKEIAMALRDILSTEGKAVLWHCTQGKDRCGLLSVILLGALGVDRETILHDFSISSDAYKPLTDHFMKTAIQMQADDSSINALQGMLGVLPSSMELALDWIEKEYGDIPNYLMNALDIKEEELEKLKSYYLV